MKRLIQTAIPAAACLLASAFAINARAEIGEAAPPLKVTEWLKGEPVDEDLKKDGKLHLVVFWAVGCAPCGRLVPALTDLQKKYEKDLIVLAVTDKSHDEVESFVTGHADQQSYRVARDEGGAQTVAKFDAAFDSGAMHTTFLIDRDGTAVWSNNGHGANSGRDASDMEDVIDKTIAGKGAEVAKRRNAEIKAYSLGFAYAGLQAAGNTEMAQTIRKRLMDTVGADSKMLQEVAWRLREAAEQSPSGKSDALAARDLIEDVMKATQEKDMSVLDAYADLLAMLGEGPKAIEYKKKALAGTPDTDPAKEMMKNELEAWEESLKLAEPAKPEPAAAPAAPKSDAAPKPQP